MNILYPGRPEYAGPNEGLACWVHHKHPIEYCTSFAERIAYIRTAKPAHQQAVRLAALTCLPLDRLPPTLNQASTVYDQARTAYDKALTAYNQAWTAYDEALTAYDQARTAHDPILFALMAELVPAHLWRDDHLVFPHSTKEAQP